MSGSAPNHLLHLTRPAISASWSAQLTNAGRAGELVVRRRTVTEGDDRNAEGGVTGGPNPGSTSRVGTPTRAPQLGRTPLSRLI